MFALKTEDLVEESKDTGNEMEPVSVSAKYSLTEEKSWMPFSTMSDFGFDLLSFDGSSFQLNPDPISKANDGVHEQTSSLVS